MAEREKGVETMPCAVCGTSQPVTENQDGSKSAGPCSKCWPETASEKASAPLAPAREKGIVPNTTEEN